MIPALLAASLFGQLALTMPAANLATSQKNIECATGVHIITVRGSTEARGADNFHGLPQQIIRKSSGYSDSYALKYPAQLQPYAPSEGTGTANLNRYIENYVDSCPDSKLVLIGYSQGAQVVMDTICGTTIPKYYNATAPISGKYAAAIGAAAAVADPTRIAGMPYDAGSANQNTRQGTVTGRNVTNCLNFYNNYQQRLRSWCTNADYYCDDGGNFTNGVHTSYFPRINDQVASWVLNKTA